ncbi:MAG TPA: GntR family transcriptional regulator, partial [Chthoniobacterales bacterium]
MPIQPVEPRRLYLQIADQVQSLIAAGEFAAGSRLPAERELAKRFGVSRPTLREALIALEVQGHVDVRPGSGIVVTTANGAAADCSSAEGPLEILRTR